MKVTLEQKRYVDDRNQKIVAMSKDGVSTSDLATLFDLTELEIAGILRGAGVVRKRKRINLAKANIGDVDSLFERIRQMRLKGFSQEYMSRILKLRIQDLKSVIEEFKMPHGYRCEDCDAQVILEYPKVVFHNKWCKACADKRDDDSTIRYIRERYRKDPVFRQKMIDNAKKPRKQAKILG